MRVLSYTGKGSGAAKLASYAFAELRGEDVPVLSPERASQHFLPYLDVQGEATIFALGDFGDTLRLAESFKLTGFEVKLVRPPLAGLPDELAAKLEVYEAHELPEDPLEAMLEAGKVALGAALEGAKGVRKERLEEDLKDLCCVEFDLPERFDVIAYTDSMELAALALSEVVGKPALHVQHLPRGLKAVVLTTSAEEHWARRLAFRGHKLVSVKYDPLVAPLAFVESLKRYRTSGSV